MKTYAFGLIDAQRGFMPAEEGERLGLPGFGELGVPRGEEIVANANALLSACVIRFTTQDWHPRETAHFAD
jgi:nicotinamidase-related amidase